MIYLNYGTSEHFEEEIGDKYYCKNKKTARKQLKELLEIQEFSKKSIDNGLAQFDGATTYRFLNTNITIKEDKKEVYANVYEVDLI